MALSCGWPDGQPCGLPTRPPPGRRLPTSSTGPHHHIRRKTRGKQQSPSPRCGIRPQVKFTTEVFNPLRPTRSLQSSPRNPASDRNRSRSRNHRSRSPKYALGMPVDLLTPADLPARFRARCSPKPGPCDASYSTGRLSRAYRAGRSGRMQFHRRHDLSQTSLRLGGQHCAFA